MYFINSWKDKTKAWSGTPEGLYKALSSKTDIKRYDVWKSDAKIKRICDRLTMRFGDVKRIERLINSDGNLVQGEPVFCFAEYYTEKIKNTYCFQDLSIDYVLRLRKSKSSIAKYALNKRTLTLFAEKRKKAADKFYADCAGVFTMSKWLHDDFINNMGLPASKVHHVGGGCSLDVNKIDSSKKTGNKFLFVGKTWELKNGPLVVEAFDLLCKKYPDLDVELYVAGPTEKPKEISNDKIKWLGRLTYEELVEYYNLCDFYVMPSQFEGYGLVFVEALCFGLPCIGKNIYAMPEFISNGENGFLIEDDDPEELAASMKNLLERKDIVQNVFDKRDYYIQKYSWDEVADRILVVMRNDGYSV